MAKWVCWIYVNTLDTKSIDIDPVSFTQINNTVNRTYSPVTTAYKHRRPER